MRYLFGQCELATETRELFVAGRRRPIEPQVFDLLHHLVKERERVVSQAELIEAVWSSRIVSDSAISARISAARLAIGDDGTRQEWIHIPSRLPLCRRGRADCPTRGCLTGGRPG